MSAVICGASGNALGADASDAPGPTLRVNGYGTLAYTSTHATQPLVFKREQVQFVSSRNPPLIPDSNLGLQASLQVNERFSLVGQVVLRRRAASAAADESLEWAFASYQLQPDLTLRIGRISPDVFLLTDHRNVGFSYPWVRPNTEFYGWMPVPFTDGLDIAKTWQRGDVRWVGKLGYGASSHLTTAASGGLQDTRFSWRNGYVATLSREEGGLTAKLSLASVRGQVNKDVALRQLFDGLGQVAALGVPGVSAEAAKLAAQLPLDGFTSRYAAVGLQWEHGPWTVQGELAKVAGDFKPINANYGYLSTGYRIGDITLTGMVGRAKASNSAIPDPQWAPILAPIDPALAAGAQFVGSAAAATGNKLRYDQKGVSLGLRWDVSAQTALKFQIDRVRVYANGAGLWGNASTAPGRADIFSAAFCFVF